MKKTKWVRLVLVITFVVSVGIVTGFTEEVAPGGEGYWTEGSTIQTQNFDVPAVPQFDAPTFEPSMSTSIAVSPMGDFSGYETPMAEQINGVPDNFSPGIQQEPTYLADQGDALERRMNTVAATLPKTTLASGGGAPDASGTLKGGDYWKADEQLNRSEIKVENQITGYLKQQTNLLNQVNNGEIDESTFATQMQGLDEKLAAAHQGMIGLESRSPLASDPAIKADIARETQLVNDYKANAAAWADGGVITGAGYDGEGTAGKARPAGSTARPAEPIAQKTDIKPADGAIWEDPATASYYPKPPKITYPSQQPAPAAPAGQESVYSKDWLRAPLESVAGVDNAYSRDWLRGPVETILGPQKNNESPSEIKIPKAM